MNTKPNNPEWQAFIKVCQTDKRIQLITETLDRPEVLGLINACNAYVSLHRAEGFGRTIAEALMLEKPVIVTNYSGNTEFSNTKNSYSVGYELVKVKNDEYQWLEDDEVFWADIKEIDAKNRFVEVKNNIRKIKNEDIKNLLSSHQISKKIKKVLL
jgi:glycosyltransferase involved in cell wall biosynthesis